MESKSISLIKENENENDDNNILFNITNYIIRNYTYYFNVYAVIIENNNNIEYISFSGTIIKFKKELKVSKSSLIMASFIICCCSAFFLLISLIKYCCYYRRYRRYDFSRYNEILEYHIDDIDDDDDLLI